MTISTLCKRVVALFSFCLLGLFMFSGCGKSNSTLPNATIERITKQIFAESNYCQNAIFMSDGDYEFLDISYSNDEYNRYLVCINLKTSVGMKYEILPIYIFFRYNSSTDQYTWHPQMIFSDEYSEDVFKKAVNWNKETTWKADEDAFRHFLDNNESPNSANENEPPQQGVDDTSPATICVTGVVKRYEYGWFISLSETVAIEDAGGTVMCDELYFYEDMLDGRPISDFEGVTVVLEGTPENYRGAGTYFLYNPVLIDVSP
jgi:hypothetical protein